MSEKRFKSTIDEDTMSIMPFLVSDNEEECFYNLKGCVDLLNKMSDEIEEVEISIKLFEDDVQNKDKKILEQQSKITELEKNFEDLVNWSTEISKRNVLLDEKIGRLQQENKELKNKLNKHL